MGRFTPTREEIIKFSIAAALNFLSEFLGTAAAIFIGCMGQVLGLGQPGDFIGSALCFGIAITVGIEIGLMNSGGLINPMLTLSAVIFRMISLPMAVVYIIAELFGAIVGFGLVKGLTPSNLVDLQHDNGLCTTVPHNDISLVQAFFVEFIASSILVLIVCAQWDYRSKLKDGVSMRVGFIVFALAYACAFYTGCSMNPARSFAPAIWNNVWKDHWIYWVGPMAAGVIWAFFYSEVFIKRYPNRNADDEEDED